LNSRSRTPQSKGERKWGPTRRLYTQFDPKLSEQRNGGRTQHAAPEALCGKALRRSPPREAMNCGAAPRTAPRHGSLGAGGRGGKRGGAPGRTNSQPTQEQQNGEGNRKPPQMGGALALPRWGTARGRVAKSGGQTFRSGRPCAETFPPRSCYLGLWVGDLSLSPQPKLGYHGKI